MPDSLIKTAPVARPILMSGPMVRATLDGRKTQTRRVVKGVALEWLDDAGFSPGFVADPGNSAYCPYGQPGDLLYVREAWAQTSIAPIVETVDSPAVVFRDCDNRCDYGGPWRPSIYMPRWASRLTLVVEGIRVERLQEISADDCEAESIQSRGADMAVYREHRLVNDLAARRYENGMRKLFRALWDPLNATRGYGWDANPWVWVVQFRPIEKNVDAVLTEATDA